MPDGIAAAGARAGAVARDPMSEVAGRRMLTLLFLVGVFNAVDRRILAVLLEPIRLEFGASDAAMGILTGSAFVLFYCLSTLPIARLADVRPRRTIILVGLSGWSAMTAVGGLAASFWHLALARVGVGVGEASFLPAAMSMVSDRFPPARRTLALAMLSIAFPVGMMVSLVIGGRLGAAVGWRATLFILGAVGLLLAALLPGTLAEPIRGAAERGRGDATIYGLGETLRYLADLSSMRHLAAGVALSHFANSSLTLWSPTFLIRVHALDVAAAGAWLGPATGLGGIGGVLAGGYVAQRMSRRDVRWLLWAPALVALLAVPFGVLFLTLPTLGAAVAAFVGVTFVGGATLAPSMAAVQGLAKLRMRALAAALVSAAVNIAGLGLGPLVAGALSDALRPRFGAESIRYALLVTVFASLWAAVHYVAGARTLRRELEGAAAA